MSCASFVKRMNEGNEVWRGGGGDEGGGGVGDFLLLLHSLFLLFSYLTNINT